MLQLTAQEKLDIVFITGELKALHDNDINAKSIERLMILKMELEEMTDTVNRFIELSKLPPVDGI